MAQKSMYDIIKKQNGEAFAQAIRKYHNGIFELPHLPELLKYAGREAPESLLRYLAAGAMAHQREESKKEKPDDPFALLEQAGYNAYYADTLEKQNAIEKYFEEHEKLCTFHDPHRFENFYIVNAVKKNVHEIKREDFKNPEREDAYGTSVISIQIAKGGNYISVKNRYNHTVDNPDNTFHSNPDNIINGLTDALQNYFNVRFSTGAGVPYHYVMDEFRSVPRIMRFNYWRSIYVDHKPHVVYFGDNFCYNEGKLTLVDKNSQLLADTLLIDMKNKTVCDLAKNDIQAESTFYSVMQEELAGKSLRVEKTADGGKVLYAGNEKILQLDPVNRVEGIRLPHVKEIQNDFYMENNRLKFFEAPLLETIGQARNLFSLADKMETPSLVFADTLFIDPKTNAVWDMEPAGDKSAFYSAVKEELAGKVLRVEKTAEGGKILYANNNDVLHINAQNCVTAIQLPTTKEIKNAFFLKRRLQSKSENHLTFFKAPALEKVESDMFLFDKVDYFYAPRLKAGKADFLKNYTVRDYVFSDSYFFSDGIKRFIDPDKEFLFGRFTVDLSDGKITDLYAGQKDSREENPVPPAFFDTLQSELAGKKLTFKRNAAGEKILYAGGQEVIKVNAQNQMTELTLPDVREIGNDFSLPSYSPFKKIGGKLEKFSAPNLKKVGNNFFGKHCGYPCLKFFALPRLAFAGDNFMQGTAVETVSLPNLRSIGSKAFYFVNTLKEIHCPNLLKAGDAFLYHIGAENVSLPLLESVGENAFGFNDSLKAVNCPRLQYAAERLLSSCYDIEEGDLSALKNKNLIPKQYRKILLKNTPKRGLFSFITASFGSSR